MELIEDDIPNEHTPEREETEMARLKKRAVWLLRRALLLLRLSIMIVPIILLSVIQLDLPFRSFDVFSGTSSELAISNWLSKGDLLLTSSYLLLVLMVRSHGAVFIGRLVGLSWLISAFLIMILLIYMAPELSATDMPSFRFLTGFLLSWYFGQLFAVYTYDYTRGGKWWRAPLYAGVVGFLVQVCIYFPIVYSHTNVPWVSWAIVDFAMKLILIVIALPIYSRLRRFFRPLIRQEMFVHS